MPTSSQGGARDCDSGDDHAGGVKGCGGESDSACARGVATAARSASGVNIVVWFAAVGVAGRAPVGAAAVVRKLASSRSARITFSSSAEAFTPSATVVSSAAAAAATAASHAAMASSRSTTAAAAVAVAAATSAAAVAAAAAVVTTAVAAVASDTASAASATAADVAATATASAQTASVPPSESDGGDDATPAAFADHETSALLTSQSPPPSLRPAKSPTGCSRYASELPARSSAVRSSFTSRRRHSRSRIALEASPRTLRSTDSAASSLLLPVSCPILPTSPDTDTAPTPRGSDTVWARPTRAAPRLLLTPATAASLSVAAAADSDDEARPRDTSTLSARRPSPPPPFPLVPSSLMFRHGPDASSPRAPTLASVATPATAAGGLKLTPAPTLPDADMVVAA
mmetsp:Transcript_35608/g.88980  ORF Transcript_35608/g.88980 Transcript_35608/m.88980 type:complete len:402 (-) Transcript_35608:1321-2526(-)